VKSTMVLTELFAGILDSDAGGRILKPRSNNAKSRSDLVVGHAR
jgi:hypothetical protein